MSRIVAAGGVVKREKGGRVARVQGVLAVTRNFGGRLIKEPKPGTLISDPHVRCAHLDETAEFLILGSDGIFDKYPSRQNLVNEVKKKLLRRVTVADTVEGLITTTLQVHATKDNRTFCVVLFNRFGRITGKAGGLGAPEGVARACGVGSAPPGEAGAMVFDHARGIGHPPPEVVHRAENEL